LNNLPDNSPSSFSITPESSLLLRFNSLSLGVLPIVGGILPVRPLFDRLSRRRSNKLDTPSGLFGQRD
jgi:hypothetical protein